MTLDDLGYRSKREVFPALVQEFGLAVSPEELFADFGLLLRQAQPMPHAAEVLAELRRRDVRLGLVTNGWSAVQRECLERCGLSGAFGVVLISEEVGLSKPDPRIYSLALDELEVTAEDAWFVGDSPRNDIQGPQEVGLRAAYLPGGHPLTSEQPDAVLRGLRDVLALSEW